MGASFSGPKSSSRLKAPISRSPNSDNPVETALRPYRQNSRLFRREEFLRKLRQLAELGQFSELGEFDFLAPCAKSHRRQSRKDNAEQYRV